MMHCAPIPVESTGDDRGNVVLPKIDPRHSRTHPVIPLVRVIPPVYVIPTKAGI